MYRTPVLTNRMRLIPHRLAGAWVANDSEAEGAVQPQSRFPTHDSTSVQRVSDALVHDCFSHRDVGAFRLLRHGRVTRSVHDRQARFRRFPREPHMGHVHRARVLRAGNRRMDRGQGAGCAPHDDLRRMCPGIGLSDALYSL